MRFLPYHLAVVLFLLVGFAAAKDPDVGPMPPLHEEMVKEVECQHCHQCDHPTLDDPCLKSFSCPRNMFSATLAPDLGPDVVILDQLEDLYVPVRFNHRAHATMTEMNAGCPTCHHYTPPDLPHPECRECHPRSVLLEDITQPGLRGAYHRQCLGCHVEWDNATECEICHAKKAGGALQGSATTFNTEIHHAPIEMAELIIVQTDYDDGDEVPFHHRAHVDVYGAECSLCHQQQNCASCHVHAEASHPMGDLAEVDLHDTCYKCHDEDNCEYCHGRAHDDMFDHADTGWPLKSYHASVGCTTCHTRQESRLSKPTTSCSACHPDGWAGKKFDHRVTGVTLDEEHGDADCSDCHTGGVGSRSVCTECHDDDRVYQRRTGFRPTGSFD